MKLSISDDKPKSSLKEDSLHREELIITLCDLIESCDATNSLTIGICGPWGSGKTSVINFVKEHLSNNCQIAFIDFNPWLYASQENLANQLLKCIAHHFTPAWKRSIQNRSSCIRSVSKMVSAVSPDNKISKLLRAFSDLLSSNPNGIPLDDFKSKVSEHLRKTNQKIVVVIDDVDRLDPNEIRMLIKLVRSIADFSNIIYLLCYDDEIVEKALSTNEYKGHDYLQKIINLPVRIPEVNGYLATEELKDHYLNIVSKTELNDYDVSVFKCISNLSLSLRDVKITTSRFHLLYDVSKNNTCPADLLALTLLDTVEPDVYRWISTNRYRLCGFHDLTIRSIMNNKTDDPSKSYIENGLSPEYIDLLSVIFPRFKPGHYIKTESEQEYRICQYSYINNYFLLTPSSLIITNEMIEKFIRITNPDELYDVVSDSNTYAVSEIVSRACYKMRNPEYFDDLYRLSNLVLTQPFSDSSFIPIQNAHNLSRIVETYLRNLSDSEKIAYLNSSIPTGDIHKIIFYGTVLEKMIGIYFTGKGDQLFRSNYETMFNNIISDLKNFDTDDSLELLLMLLLISRVDKARAKQVFIGLKPSYDDRKSIYLDLAHKNTAPDFLIELADDPRGNYLEELEM